MPNRFRLVPLALAASALLAPVLSHAGADAGSCRYLPVAKLPLRFSPLNQPLVDGSINGKPATLMLDTGAYKTFLTRTGIDRLAIPVRASRRKEFGVGGASDTYTATLDDFSIGAIHSGRIALPVIANSTKFPFDGIFGADSMRELDLEIALAEKFIQFFKASGCADTKLAYWDKDAMEIAYDTRPADSNRPRFPAELNGMRLEAILDTGAMRTGVRRAVAERLGITPGTPAAPLVGFAQGVGNGKAALWRANFDSISIGSETIQNAQLDIVDTSPQGDAGKPDVVLGADFLRAHRVLIAPSQKRLYMSYVGGQVFSSLQPTAKRVP